MGTDSDFQDHVPMALFPQEWWGSFLLKPGLPSPPLSLANAWEEGGVDGDKRSVFQFACVPGEG